MPPLRRPRHASPSRPRRVGSARIPADTVSAMRDPRVTRRKAIVGLLGAAALLELVVAIVVLGGGGNAATQPTALPLHPVAGSFRPDDTTLAECSQQVCFEQAFGNVAYYQGPRTALVLFDKTFEEGDASCHRVAHAIGAASLARNEGNVARTFAEGSSSCWSGYYHGVLERSLVQAKSRKPAALAAVARTLCEDPGVRRVNWLAYQCLHGLGHGLMISTGYALPLSLDTCRALHTNWDRTSCKGGVFMENVTPSYGIRSPWLRDDDPVYPCNWVVRADKRMCYGMVTSRILRVIGLDWEETAKICSLVERDFVSTCFTSFGRDVSGQTSRNPEDIVELCAVTRPHGGEADCVESAAKDMTANYTSGKPAAALCELAAARLQDGCFYAIGSIAGRFTTTPAARKADCQAVSELSRHVAACIRGAASTESGRRS